MWSVHTAKGSLLHRKDRRILLTLDSPSGSLTWVMAAPFIVSGLTAARSHNQGHRKPHVSLPHSSDTVCNSVRRLMVLYPSLELSFQALKSKTDMSKESSHLLHGKGQGSDEAQPSAEGRGLFPLEGLPCWAVVSLWAGWSSSAPTVLLIQPPGRVLREPRWQWEIYLCLVGIDVGNNP